MYSNSGSPLLPYLDGLPSITRHEDGPVKFPVIDRYKVYRQCSSMNLHQWLQLIDFFF